MSHRHAQQFRSAHPAGRDHRRNPHFDQQGGTRVAGSIGAKVSTAGPAVERDSDPPDLTPSQVVRVWKRNGEFVVYEYKDGHRRPKLSYTVKEPSRNFYREGDILLVHEVEKRYGEREFPELKEPDGDDISVFDLVMMLLGEYEEEKYKLGWQILRVSDVGWGGGVIIVQGVIFFDSVPTALTKRAEFSVDDLNVAFIQSRTAQQLETLVPILEFTAELSETLLGGAVEQLEKVAAKRLFKEAARAAMKRGMKKAFNKLLRGMATSAAKAGLAFVKAFAKEFWKDMHSADKKHALQERLGVRDLPKQVERLPIFEKAVIAGANSAAAALVKDCLEKPLGKWFEKILAKMFPKAETSLSQKMLSYFTGEIRKLVTTEALTTVIGALTAAWKGRIDASGKPDEKQFGKLFEDKLLSDLTKAFKKRFDSWIEGLSKDQFEDMKF